MYRDNRLRLWLIFGQLGHIKLNGVAPFIPDPPDATPPLGKINPFEIHHIFVIFVKSVHWADLVHRLQCTVE